MGIKRAKRDRWIFGVCGGVARSFGWSPIAVRLAVILLAVLIPGFSVIPTVLVYVALGFLLPEEDF